MKISIRSSFIAFVSLTILVSGCAPAATPVPTTATSLPTNTPKPTSTPSPTATPALTKTPTSLPYSSSYNPAPRWMILSQPGYGVEIFGEPWKYTNDRWGDTYACIDYTREKEPYLFFEQCFALTQPDLTFESQRDALLDDDFEILTPNNRFGDVGQISLMAKRLEDNSEKFVKFFEIIGFEKFILLVEMNFTTDDPTSLQSIYEGELSAIVDYVLQNMLEKSRLVPRPTATPLTPIQAGFYEDLAHKLITEEGANEIYSATIIGIGSIDGTWEAIEDIVDSENPMVCRHFEDRTNADVLWVYFSNCVYLPHPDFFSQFADFAESKKLPDNVFLESRHQYDDQFFLYGQFHGHTFFHAWMIRGEYMYFVQLESRSIGDANVGNNFTKEVDDFIYDVLMINSQK